MNLPKSAVNKISPISIGDVLERDRLFSMLQQDPPTKAFWISGPGGSGKTTLISSFLEKEKLPCLWYQVDALDGDPATFFYYFGQAAASLLVSPDPPMPLLTPEYLPHIDVFILRYFETLYQRIEPHTWLIFDNFHDAPDDSALSQLLAIAVKQLPSHINIAIVSRNDPPPVMTRFLANRTMQRIAWNQLAFTGKEFTAFLELFETRIAKDDAERLYRFTRGWIAGAILWLLHDASDVLPKELWVEQTPENIFDYFVAEILEKSTGEIRNFLLQTSFFPSMTADMAGELTGMEAEDILETLYRKNFFLEKRRLPVVSYQYHPLFREFLLLQAGRIFGPDTLRTTRCRAAEILERHGLPEEAVRLYFQAKAYKQIEVITLSQALELVNQGRYAVLSSWIDCLPAASIETHPYLLFWKGVSLTTVNPQDSSRLCTKAYELFARNNDFLGQVLSWSASVNILIMLRRGFTELDKWISEGDQMGRLLPDDEDNADLAGRIAAGMLIALLLRNPSHPDMAQWQMRCESLLDRCREPQVTLDLIKNLYWSYQWMGQIRKSLIMETRLRLLLKIENLSPLGQIIFHVGLAISRINRGDHRECHKMTTKALSIAEETGIHVVDFIIISHAAWSLLGSGDLEQVPQVLEKLKATLASHAVWDQGQYHLLVAWYEMQDGNLVAAQEQVELAVKLVEFCGTPFPVSLCRIVQSQVCLERGEPQKSENLLAAIRNEPRLGNNKVIHFLVDLACADTAYTQSQTTKSDLYCKAAFIAAREEGGIFCVPYGLANRRLGAVCAHALEAGIEEDMVVEMIRNWHLQPPDPKTVNDRWPWPVRIFVLGRFEIHNDGKPLTLSGKTPRKPLELLTLLICAGQTGIFREAVADKLWPDSDGDLALQTLNTTLHRLRKLLGRNETVIQKGSQLFLNRKLCWVDCWHFQWQIEQIESTGQKSAKKHIIQALALYRGPFTTGHQDLSMAVGYSSQLNRQWLGVVAAAVPLFVRSDMDNESRKVIHNALAEDETAAAVFPILVRDFKKTGREADAPEILHRCRSLLAEQGIKCGCKTMAFFSDLQGKQR